MTSSTALKYITWLLGIILFASVLVFALNNRISIDDMFYYARCQQVGIKGMVAEQYYGYSGRFMAYYLNGFVLAHFTHGMLVLWNVISIALFFTVLYLFCRSYTHLPAIKGPGWILLFAAILFGSSGPDEQFFWYTQVNTYLWSAICALTVLFILYKKHFTLIHGFLLIASCVFLAGASESITIQLGLLMTLWAVTGFKKASALKRVFFVVGILSLIAVGYFSIFSKGNQIRSEIIHSLNDTGFFRAMASSLYHYFTDPAALESILWLLPLVTLMMFFTTSGFAQVSLVKLTLSYGFLLLCFMIPTAWALREPAPTRALISCDILTVFYLISVFSKLRWFTQENQKVAGVLSIGLLLAAGIFYGNQCMQYSHAYDTRHRTIKATHKLVFTPMPHVRMLKAADIRNDSIHYTQFHMRLYYGLQPGLAK